MNRSKAIWNYFLATGYIGAYLFYRELDREEASSRDEEWLEEKEG